MLSQALCWSTSLPQRSHSSTAGGRLAHPWSPPWLVVAVSIADSRKSFGPPPRWSGLTR